MFESSKNEGITWTMGSEEISACRQERLNNAKSDKSLLKEYEYE